MDRREAMKALFGVPLAGAAHVIPAKPGDVIVFETPDYPDDEQLAHIQGKMRETFPTHRHVILTGGASLKVVTQ